VVQPFLSQMPAPQRSGGTPGTYINSVASLTGNLPLNTASGPDTHDTFYAKSLTTPQASPIPDAARKAFMNYLANDGFNANTVRFNQLECSFVYVYVLIGMVRPNRTLRRLQLGHQCCRCRRYCLRPPKLYVHIPVLLLLIQ